MFIELETTSSKTVEALHMEILV